MTELPDTTSTGLTEAQNHNPEEVIELEITFKLPSPTIRLFFRMGDQLGLNSKELAQLAIEEYARNHFDSDLPKPERGWSSVNEP